MVEWLLGRGIKLSVTPPTGAEWDKCLTCNVIRKYHSLKIEGHHFQEEE